VGVAGWWDLARVELIGESSCTSPDWRVAAEKRRPLADAPDAVEEGKGSSEQALALTSKKSEEVVRPASKPVRGTSFPRPTGDARLGWDMSCPKPDLAAHFALGMRQKERSQQAGVLYTQSMSCLKLLGTQAELAKAMLPCTAEKDIQSATSALANNATALGRQSSHDFPMWKDRMRRTAAVAVVAGTGWIEAGTIGKA
jgi:hypothetical protein